MNVGELTDPMAGTIETFFVAWFGFTQYRVPNMSVHSWTDLT